jgi:hypothetical protein
MKNLKFLIIKIIIDIDYIVQIYRNNILQVNIVYLSL